MVVYFGEKKQSTCKRKRQTIATLPETSERKAIVTEGSKSLCEAAKSQDSNDMLEDRRVNTIVSCPPSEVIERCDKRPVTSHAAAQCRSEEMSEGMELETHKGAGIMSTRVVSHKKKIKYQILSAADIHVWPVCIAPTADEAVCLSTVLVQLPSSDKRCRDGGEKLCTGTAILDYPKATLKEQERDKGKKKGLRFRRKHRLAPAPPTHSTATTQL